MLSQAHTHLPWLSLPPCADPKDQPKVEVCDLTGSFLSVCLSLGMHMGLHSRSPGICRSPLKRLVPRGSSSLVPSFPDLWVCQLLALSSLQSSGRQLAMGSVMPSTESSSKAIPT